MKSGIKNIAALGIGLTISLALCEIILHFYNPFKSRVRGNEILLPANVKYEFKDQKIRGLDAQILHTKNSMGFRGPELPKDPATLKIFCVGGSTTECFYLSDGKDWPALLMKKMQANGQNVWINNAGLDGHSTFGHIKLLRDHILKYKPDYVLFLIGCNDVAADGLNKFEGYHLNNKKRFFENFEMFNLYLNWKMSRNAANMGMGHKPVDFANWPKADTTGWMNTRDSWLTDDIKERKLLAFSERIDSLRSICFAVGIQCVFITQPSILSNNIDPITRRYLGNLKFQGKSALHYFTALDTYNEQLRSCGSRIMDGNLNKFYWVVDAANVLKPTTQNYYDFFHYTNAGAEKMADIVFENWGKKIQNKYTK